MTILFPVKNLNSSELSEKWIFIEVAILNVAFVFMSMSVKVFSWNCIYTNISEWYVRIWNKIKENFELRIARFEYKFLKIMLESIFN